MEKSQKISKSVVGEYNKNNSRNARKFSSSEKSLKRLMF